MDHLQRLLSSGRTGPGLQRAAHVLASKGYTATDQVYVQRTSSRGSSPASSFGVKYDLPLTFPLKVGQTFATTDGELVFWSWNDGDPWTWEGTIFGQRYADGAYHIADGQINIETANYYPVWAEDIDHDEPLVVHAAVAGLAPQARTPAANRLGAFLQRANAATARPRLDLM